MTGPIVPARLGAGYVDPAQYRPPAPWVRFYVTLHRKRAGEGTRTQRTLGSLTKRELSWVARCVLAEIEKRS